MQGSRVEQWIFSAKTFFPQRASLAGPGRQAGRALEKPPRTVHGVLEGMNAIKRHSFLTGPLRAGLIAALLLAGTSATAQEPVAAWVQHVPGWVQVRAVVSGGCPVVEIDGTPVAMRVRSEPSELHPSAVCVAEVPQGARGIDLNGVELPVPGGTPQRIAITGDTGCRVSARRGAWQACRNAALWPFARIAESIAAWQPDLIIHAGDYIYRDAPCPRQNRGCSGTPFGDSQATWKADFLTPAAPMLAAAPMLFARGNHEDCGRAGRGWFHYLSPRTPPPGCALMTEPWVMDAGSLSVAVMDSSSVRDANGQSLAGAHSRQLSRIGGLEGEHIWLLSHRPFWGVGRDGRTGEIFESSQIMPVPEARAALPPETALLLAGHIHLAEAVVFSDGRPPQIVAGNGGAQLDTITGPVAELNGVALDTFEVINQYGFVTLENTGAGAWRVVFRDIEGRALETCALGDGRISCAEGG
jgi:hypothetical protein